MIATLLDKQCESDDDCTLDKSCYRGTCRDPCALRAACGDNAICRVVLHRPRCECPECYFGKPHIQCRINPGCTSPSIVEPPSGKECSVNTDCSESLYCNAGQCSSPCGHTSVCEANEKCVARNHQAQCQCKFKYVISSNGDLSCPERQVACRSDSECPAHLGCLNGICASPCQPGACPAGKTCQVLDHKALCVCDKDCESSVSICLKDKGCPSNQACINYKCVNPCEGKSCPNNTPCIVEEHLPVCKFCPPGFAVDTNYGCVKGQEHIEAGYKFFANKDFPKRLNEVFPNLIF